MRTLASTALSALLLFFLSLFAAGTAHAQLPGRYFTPDALSAQMNNSATERAAQLYLMGAYDLSQDSGQSCAARGTTTPAQLEQVFSQYLQAHPELMHADRTAAGVAAQAFVEHWPCQEPQSQSSPTPEPDANAAQPSPNQDQPLTLNVWSAQRRQTAYGVTTQIIGSLSDDPQQQQLHMTCDVGIFSIGPDGKVGNQYPARHSDKSNEIKIATREQGSNKMHEHTCKF